jgi:tetratricopeptide (TPR) repeat protein
VFEEIDDNHLIEIAKKYASIIGYKLIQVFVKNGFVVIYANDTHQNTSVLVFSNKSVSAEELYALINKSNTELNANVKIKLFSIRSISRTAIPSMYIDKIEVISGDSFIEELKKYSLLETKIESDRALPSSVYFSSLLKQAEAYENNNDIKKAIEIYNEAVKIKPEVGFLWLKLGYYYQKDDPEKAIEYFKKAIECDIEDPNAWIALANVLSIMGRHEEEVECYDYIIKLRPNMLEAYINKSVALYYLNKLDEAIDTLLPISEKNKSPEIYNNLGVLYRKKGNLNMARFYFQKSIAINPDFVDAKINIINMELESGIYSRALKYAEELYKNEKKIEYAKLYANALFKFGNIDKAIEIAKEYEDDPFFKEMINKVEKENEKVIVVKEIYALSRNGYNELAKKVSKKEKLSLNLYSDNRQYNTTGNMAILMKKISNNEFLTEEEYNSIYNEILSKTDVNMALNTLYLLFLHVKYDDIIYLINNMKSKISFPAIFNNLLGIALALKKEKEEAISHFQQAIKEDPEYKDPLENISTINSKS